ncbi:MAG: hypothetical protein DRJ64_00635 [Thermoprotei archaeon]|nr:MAG: hypothetical protein DRJ64_00635 [Thermoprotei archaeon]
MTRKELLHRLHNQPPDIENDVWQVWRRSWLQLSPSEQCNRLDDYNAAIMKRDKGGKPCRKM